MLQVVDLRQIDGVDQREPGQRTGDHRQQRAAPPPCEPAGELAPALGGGTAESADGEAGQAARFQTLWGIDCQANQASSASLTRMHERRRCFSLRLALRRYERMCNGSRMNHGMQDWECVFASSRCTGFVRAKAIA